MSLELEPALGHLAASRRFTGIQSERLTLSENLARGITKCIANPLHSELVPLRTCTKWWKTTRRDRATDWVDWGLDDHCGQAPYLQMRKPEQWGWILKSDCLISIISQLIISGKWVCLLELSFCVYKMGTLWPSTYSASYLPVPQLNERSTDS